MPAAHRPLRQEEVDSGDRGAGPATVIRMNRAAGSIELSIVAALGMRTELERRDECGGASVHPWLRLRAQRTVRYSGGPNIAASQSNPARPSGASQPSMLQPRPVM